MPRPGITREQVFEAADALVLEGQSPTVVAVRTKLGGGSPNTITPLLAEWRESHESARVEAQPPLPESVESAMRQVWGTAWKDAQEQLEAEREALGTVRKDIERERAEMLAEITRLDGELDATRESVRAREEDLQGERRALEQVRADVREARAIAAEREKRIGAQDTELREVRGQADAAGAKVARLEADLAHARTDLEAARAAVGEGEKFATKLTGQLDQAQRQIDGLTSDLKTATAAGKKSEAALQKVQATAAELRQARADLIAERDQATAAGERLSAELQRAQEQTQEAQKRIEAGEKKLKACETAVEEERREHTAAEKALGELRVEAATLKERAAHAAELRELLQKLQQAPEPKPAAPSRPPRGKR